MGTMGKSLFLVDMSKWLVQVFESKLYVYNSMSLKGICQNDMKTSKKTKSV